MIAADGGLGLGGLGLLLLLGMARHASTRRENLALHPVRSAILQAIAAESGIVLSDLRRRIGCSAGTIQHHVRHLERGGLIADVSVNHRRWIFPAGVPPETCILLAVLHSGRAWDLAQSLARTPGQAQRDLARGASVSRRAVRGQVARLVRSGLAVAVPRGRTSGYYPTERLLRLLAVRSFGPAEAPTPVPTPVQAAAPPVQPM